jgi:hypothetical protein
MNVGWLVEYKGRRSGQRESGPVIATQRNNIRTPTVGSVLPGEWLSARFHRCLRSGKNLVCARDATSGLCVDSYSCDSFTSLERDPILARPLKAFQTPHGGVFSRAIQQGSGVGQSLVAGNTYTGITARRSTAGIFRRSCGPTTVWAIDP